jgi:hypothetical protein
VDTFAHCTFGSKPFYSFLFTVLSLVLLGTMAACLGCIALSADVAIIVAAEALLYSTGTVIELADVDVSVPYHPSVDDSVGHFWVPELYHN